MLRILSLATLMSETTYADIGISPGKGSYWFSRGKRSLRVWYYCPRKLLKTTPVCFVMHGASREGQRYRDSWIELADEGRFLLLVPEFDHTAFPNSAAYNLGNITDGSGKFNSAADWSYRLIDEIFDRAVEQLGLQIKHYSIYGFSAGAQFVHRLALFCPNAKFQVAIAANAGWYTFLDEDIEFPYGIEGTNLSKAQIKNALGKELIILLGTEDIDPNHKYLRNSQKAKAQGAHRLARGLSFYSQAEALADTFSTPFNWELIQVQGVAHSNPGMSKEAVKYLNK